jgi:adhesin transport system outer membrane protein
MERLDAKYEVILVQLELARDLGVLADGGAI